MSYDLFADFYDELTVDVNYEERTRYILSLFEKYSKVPSLLLDVGCGTGSFASLFAKSGIDVIAVDPSSSMLSIAREKAEKENLSILFLNQSGEDLDLYGTVDGVVSCLDTVNHIIDKKTLQRFFNRISLFMEQGSLFIFDVNTKHKHENILGNNCFVMDSKNTFCVWQNFYDKKSMITDISLDFFIKKDDFYERFSENFSERFYDNETLSLMLEKAGFKILKIFEENTYKKPKEKTERAVFIVRKEN